VCFLILLYLLFTTDERTDVFHSPHSDAGRQLHGLWKAPILNTGPPRGFSYWHECGNTFPLIAYDLGYPEKTNVWELCHLTHLMLSEMTLGIKKETCTGFSSPFQGEKRAIFISRHAKREWSLHWVGGQSRESEAARTRQ